MVTPPLELELGSEPMLRISVFMNVFNCHVNRSPMRGSVRRIAYRAGRFLNAELDKASQENERNGLVKVNPVAAWSFDDVLSYAAAHKAPVNLLVGFGYPSIGCEPCTKPVAPGEDPRSGRWAGSAKTECGLHE